MARKVLLVAYLLILLWLVLFKFSYDPITVIRDFGTRGLNLIPFAFGHKSEMISNLVVFIPLGVLLGLNFKQTTFWQKLAAIFAGSLAVEVIQFALAIGVADITDVIMNTLGGFIGIACYKGASKYLNNKYLDRGVVILGAFLLLAVLYLRIFVFRVRY